MTATVALRTPDDGAPAAVAARRPDKQWQRRPGGDPTVAAAVAVALEAATVIDVRVIGDSEWPESATGAVNRAERRRTDGPGRDLGRERLGLG